MIQITYYLTASLPRTGTASELPSVVTGVKNWSLSLATLQPIPSHFGITHKDHFYHSHEHGLFYFSLILVISYFLGPYPIVDKVVRLCSLSQTMNKMNDAFPIFSLSELPLNILLRVS